MAGILETGGPLAESELGQSGLHGLRIRVTPHFACVEAPLAAMRIPRKARRA